MPTARRASSTKLLLALVCAGWLGCDGILGISAGDYVAADAAAAEAGAEAGGGGGDSSVTDGSFDGGDAGDSSDGSPQPVDASHAHVALAVASSLVAGCAVYGAPGANAAAGGALFCWGYFGSVLWPQVGGTGPMNDFPAEVTPVGKDIVDVAITVTGAYCVVHATGRVSCAGSNQFGELGRDTQGAFGGWAAVPSLTNAVQIVAGTQTVCARLASGEVDCWGDNRSGELGIGVVPIDGSPGSQPFPGKAVASGALDVAIGAQSALDHVCAVVDGGVDVVCWGDNHDGRLGHDAGKDSQCYLSPTLHNPCSGSPVQVEGLRSQFNQGETVVHLALTRTTSCALTSEKRLFCWGGSFDGELAVPFADHVTPRQIPSGADDVTRSNEAALCVLVDGGVACSGDDSFGLLGPAIDRDAEVTYTDYQVRFVSNRFVPIAFPAPGVRVVRSFVGSYVGLAALSDGRVFSWGTGPALGRTVPPSTIEAPAPAVDSGPAFTPDLYPALIYTRTPAPVANLPPP